MPCRVVGLDVFVGTHVHTSVVSLEATSRILERRQSLICGSIIDAVAVRRFNRYYKYTKKLEDKGFLFHDLSNWDNFVWNQKFELDPEPVSVNEFFARVFNDIALAKGWKN